MRPFRDIPVRRKLTFVITLTSALALVLASAVFVAHDLLALRQRTTRDLLTLADVIGKNCTAPLVFDDADAARDVLAALAAKPSVETAVLTARGGAVFARYVRRGAAEVPAPPAGPEGWRFLGSRLLVTHRITLEGEPVGTLQVVSETTELGERLAKTTGTALLVLLVTFVLALLVSARLQRVISTPILRLAGAAAAVSAGRDYSVRVEKLGDDELGVLTDAFNNMLAQIQARDEALLKSQRELQERVRQLQLEIAQREQAEEALRRSEEQLVQAQRMEAIGKLAGGVAHDFNNLLTAIKGYGDLLLRKMDQDSPLRPNAEEILRSANRAADLTRQLLAFSRKQMLVPKVLDLDAVVANMEKMLRRLIGEDIELVTRGRTAPGTVKADPGQLEQVILNLAVNARDAMPSGGRLTIETANVDVAPGAPVDGASPPPGRYVMLSVRDTGDGMAPEVKAHIFEPFFTTKARGRGTGLGLSTVFGIVTQSGGHIVVDSEPGAGTVFRIYLPRLDEAAAVEERPEARPTAPRGSETILLVEDEDQVRGAVQQTLLASGYTVLAAPDGAEAFRVFAQRHRDIRLVLTDVVMPRMSGKELCERVTALRPDMKVLFMSGYSDAEIVHEGVLEEGIAFIQKPFAPGELAARVREVLDGGERRAAA
ncbi:MAG: response regulator [Candidatus Eisenbacteria bacterium]|nr:response regulator [Candidatus Eisenbacteria bacterium]